MKNLIFLITALFLFSKTTHSQPGELDSSFAKIGVIKTDLGAKFEYAYVEKQVLELPDGSMYVILEQDGQTLMTKRDKDGKTDLSFGINGTSRTVALVQAHALLQPDGKVVIVGATTLNNRKDFIIARYNTNGSRDNSFSGDGKQTTKFASSAYATAVALQNDGKIVVAGYTSSINDMGETNADFAVARYNADGTLDKTFGEEGKLVTTGNSTDDTPTSIAVQDNGKIVVAGYSVNNTPNDNYSFSTIIRYNENGSIDNSFSADNEKFGFLFAYPNAIALQKDGKIVVTGQSITSTFITGQDDATTTTDIFVARYNTNGSIDKTFNQKGWQTSDFGYDNENAFAIVIDSNSKIVIGCNIWNGNNTDFALARYNTNGGLDSTFSNNGLQRTDFDFGEENANFLAVHESGRIIVAGSSNYSNFAVAHYNSNGSLDTDFDNDGKLSNNLNKFDQGSTFFESTAIQSDGKIVAGGNTWNGSNTDFAVIRYNTNGGIDSTFNFTGVQTTDLSVFKDGINSIAVQRNGKIVAGGFTSDQSGTRFALARYNISGSLDSTFSGNGIQNSKINLYGQINSIAVQKDGKIVVAGNVWNGSNADIAVARYNADGSIDSTFSSDGVLQTDIGNNEDNGKSIAIQSNGKIIVVGSTYNYANTDFVVIRYNADGTFDNTFGTNGILTANIGGNDDAAGVAIQADGKIVVTGSMYQFNDYDYSNTDFATIRYNSNGTLDNTFGKNGVVTTDLGNNDIAHAIIIESNGKIIVGGSSNSRFAVVRYTADGSLDTTFSQNGISNSASQGNNAIENTIEALAISNNRLYAAGWGKYPGNQGVTARYILDEGLRKPIVSITAPTNHAIFAAPARIKINAKASDPDGTITKVEFYNDTTLLHTEYAGPYGFMWRDVPAGNYTFTAKATDNSGMATVSAPVKVSVVPHKAPTVAITNPANYEVFTGPATINLVAAAIDPESAISRVKFYNGKTLLSIDSLYPYTYAWKDVPAGNYLLTAKASNSFGLVTTSAVVNITVVPNKAPTVIITSIANGQKFAAPAAIPLTASAKDPDGKISKVEFFNNTTLINTQYIYPYTFNWKNIPAGTYRITAKATDNLGLSATTAPVKIIVAAPDAPIVSSKSFSADKKTAVYGAEGLKVWPNPTVKTLIIYPQGLPQNVQSGISIISASGVVMKTIQSNSSNRSVQVDVSSLASGIYTIKVTCGDKVINKQFIKL